MKIARSLAELKERRAELNGSAAFVPTMGALHDGHLSLMRLGHAHADHVIVSIYVNPTQFAPHEDFDSYPRDVDHDLGLLDDEDIALVYLPTTEELYPNGPNADIKAGPAGDGLEAAFRPHFFHGVCSVVSRLFDHVSPDCAIFGEKDYQQLQVIREMVQQQGRNIEIIGGPIARDEYGLALSSRNAYLSPEQLEIARKFNVILRDATDSEQAKTQLLEAGFDKIDYVETRWNRILGAGWVGKTRLIDNLPMQENE